MVLSSPRGRAASIVSSLRRPLGLAGLGLALAALPSALGACGGGESGTGGSGTGSTGTGTGGAGEPVVILDWNLHNFFDDKKNSTAPQETVVSTAEYQAHVSSAAAVLSALDPDVAVFAEIENQPVLEALNQKLGGKYADLAIVPSPNDPRGINVAAISKIMFTCVVSHQTDSFTLHGAPAPSYKYTRDCVEYHFTKNGRNIILLGVHFRSKVAPDDPNKRLAEAQHTRDIADGLAKADPTAAIIILGDMNDVPGSEPVTAAQGTGASAYTDAASSAPSGDQWSFLFMGTQELIDHQLSNPVLAPMLDTKSVQIKHGADVDAASDHGPIVATYLVK
jgi:predicted extracellular nuclease